MYLTRYAELIVGPNGSRTSPNPEGLELRGYGYTMIENPAAGLEDSQERRISCFPALNLPPVEKITLQMFGIEVAVGSKGTTLLKQIIPLHPATDPSLAKNLFIALKADAGCSVHIAMHRPSGIKPFGRDTVQLSRFHSHEARFDWYLFLPVGESCDLTLWIDKTEQPLMIRNHDGQLQVGQMIAPATLTLVGEPMVA